MGITDRPFTKRPIITRRRAVQQAIATTEIIVLWATVDEDMPSSYLTYSAGVWTAKQAGLFRITWGGNQDGAAGTKANHIRLGSTTTGTVVASAENSSVAAWRWNISITLRLAVNDTFIASSYMNLNGNLTVTGNTPYINIEYLGP